MDHHDRGEWRREGASEEKEDDICASVGMEGRGELDREEAGGRRLADAAAGGRVVEEADAAWEALRGEGRPLWLSLRVRDWRSRLYTRRSATKEETGTGVEEEGKEAAAEDDGRGEEREEDRVGLEVEWGKEAEACG